MKLFKIFLVFSNLLIICFCFKTPNPSPTVLIVNHLNYLRYDFFSNPTSLREIGYPFYGNIENRLANRTRNLDQNLLSYINRTNNLNEIINLRSNFLNQNNDTSDSTNQQLNIQDLNSVNENQISTTNLTQETDSENTQQSQPNYLEDNLLQLSSLEQVDTSISSTNSILNEESISLILDADSPFLRNQEDAEPLNFNQDELSSTLNINEKNDDGSNIEEETLFNSDLNNRLLNENIDEFLADPSFDLFELSSNDQNLSLNPDILSENQFLYDSSSNVFLPDEINNNFLSAQNSNIDDQKKDCEEATLDENLNVILNGPYNNSDKLELNESFCLANDNIFERDDLMACSSNSDELLPSPTLNQASTLITPQLNSDEYIHELLSDEELQIIGFSNLSENLPILDDFVNTSNGVNDILNDVLPIIDDNRIDINSDSAVSVMSRSDLFDSNSESSSNFEDCFSYRKKENSKNKCKEFQKQIAKLNCSEASSSKDIDINNSTYFDRLDIDDPEINLSENLLPRTDIFDQDEISVLDSNSQTNIHQDFVTYQSSDSLSDDDALLRGILHNHTYINNDENISVGSSSISNGRLSRNFNLASTSGRSSYSSIDSVFDISHSRSHFNSNSFDMISVTSETSSEEDRILSRDEKKAKDLQIPISVCEIINMPIDEFNECLSKYDLNEMQLTLVRDIRRRGKNKVAAQNCRKRKINQIIGLQNEVDYLHSQKNDLAGYYDQLSALKELAQNKYQKLYQYILERSETNAALLANFELNFKLVSYKRNSSEEIYGAVGGYNSTSFDENDTNQLNEMSSTGEILSLKNLTVDIKPNHKISSYKKALAMN